MANLAFTSSSGYLGSSPTEPKVPAATHPPTRASNQSSRYPFAETGCPRDPWARHTAGKEILWPKMVVDGSAFVTSCTVRMTSLTRWSAVKLFWNDMPEPAPAIPPTSPEQATPSHTGHTRQVGYRRSRAFVRTSAEDRRALPAPAAPDGPRCCAEALAGSKARPASPPPPRSAEPCRRFRRLRRPSFPAAASRVCPRDFPVLLGWATVRSLFVSMAFSRCGSPDYCRNIGFFGWCTREAEVQTHLPLPRPADDGDGNALGPIQFEARSLRRQTSTGKEPALCYLPLILRSYTQDWVVVRGPNSRRNDSRPAHSVTAQARSSGA